MPVINSEDYHDYVFQNGKLVGEFEQMYRKSRDIPWHQDKAPDKLDCRITLDILEKYKPFKSVLDIGAGMGYITGEIARFCRKNGTVMGTDISETAVQKAQSLFPELKFTRLDITADLKEQGWAGKKYHLVFIRALFWYVFHKMKKTCANITELTEDGGYFLLQQNFPPLDSKFVGKEVLPDPEALLKYFRPYYVELLTLYLEDNKLDQVNDNWIYMFGKKR